jgi:hypothetical protein
LEQPVINYSCPTCQAKHTAPLTDGGKKLFCSSCGQKLQVPQVQNRTVLGKLEDAASMEEAPRSPSGLRGSSASPVSGRSMPEPYAIADREGKAAPTPSPIRPPARPRYDTPADAGASRIKPGLVAGLIGAFLLVAVGLFIVAALVASRRTASGEPDAPAAGKGQPVVVSGRVSTIGATREVQMAISGEREAPVSYCTTVLVEDEGGQTQACLFKVEDQPAIDRLVKGQRVVIAGTLMTGGEYKGSVIDCRFVPDR